MAEVPDDTVPTLCNLADLLTNVAEIPSYETIETIGSGGFSNVLKVKDNTTGKLLALKKISMKKMLKYYEGNVLKLLREVQLHKGLGPSVHIVEYVDHWVEEGQLRKDIEAMFSEKKTRFTISDSNSYWWFDSLTPDSHLCIRYELCNFSLATWLRGDRTGNVWPILKQLAAGISYLHEKSVVHRDIKPENILCKIEDAKPSVWKYADFGLANDVASEPSTSKGQHGTRTYRAPELSEPRVKNTYKSDIYSLGLVFLELITNAERNDDHPLFTKARRDNLELKKLKIIQPENNHPSGFEATGGFVFENTDIRIPLENYSLWRLTWEMMRRDPDKRPSAEQLVERLQQAEEALEFLRSMTDQRSVHSHDSGVLLHLVVDTSLALHLNTFTRTIIQDATAMYQRITSFLDYTGHSSPKLIHMTFIPGNKYVGLSDGEMITAEPEWFWGKIEGGKEREAIAHIIGTTIMSIEKYDADPAPPDWWVFGLSRYFESYWYLDTLVTPNFQDPERYESTENNYANAGFFVNVLKETFGDACIQAVHRSGREGKFQEELDRWLDIAGTSLDEMWDSLVLSHLSLTT